MAECLKEISLQALWQCEITEQEEEEYINDQVVPLNHMVRESYLKYLKQVLTKNLNMCSDTSNIYAHHDIEKCAGLLELKAFRLCMVTSLYQKAMLQMVADIKWHTKISKMYHKFEEIMSENCICKVSKCKATQTDLLEVKLEESGNLIQNSVNIKTEVPDEKEINNFSSDCDDTIGRTSHSISSDKDLNEPSVTRDFSNVCNPFSSNHSNNDLEISEKIDNGAVNESHRDEMNNCKDKDRKVMLQNGDKTLLDSSTQNESMDSLDKSNFNVSSNVSNISPLHESNLGTDADEEAIKQLKRFLTDDSKSEFGEALLYETATQELIRILESDGELSEEETSNNKTKAESVPQSCKNEPVDPFWTTQKHLQKKKLHENISKMCCDPDAKSFKYDQKAIPLTIRSTGTK
ncbi:uncharacterized protein GBIM_05202 [Gryllus bimaculatus]|nr:uncharacterized protein GBIM_05202 [Gryllus bimaculatus]